MEFKSTSEKVGERNQEADPGGRWHAEKATLKGDSVSFSGGTEPAPGSSSRRELGNKSSDLTLFPRISCWSILWRNELTTLLTFSLPWLGKHKQENHTNIYLSLFNGSVCPRDSFTQATDCFPTEQKPYKDLACYPAHSTCSINVSKCYDWNVHASWWVWHHWPPPIATGENTALRHLAAQTQENPVTP